MRTSRVNFYPRPPRGGRPRTGWTAILNELFLSTPSARRATARHSCWQTADCNFYPRPPRGGRPQRPRPRPPKQKFLSTPSARRATRRCLKVPASSRTISIHALREEGDPSRASRWPSSTTFLSTPSARRATKDRGIVPGQHTGFLSTPSARRATRDSFTELDNGGFLSTPSARRATEHSIAYRVTKEISIHALREEGDAAIAARRPPSNDFYPRPPRGGRQGGLFFDRDLFQISIHALREEGDI